MNNLETLQCRIEQAFPLSSSIYSTTALTIICVSMTTRNTAFPLNAKTHWDKKEQKQRRRNTFTPFHQKNKSSLEWTKKKITTKTKKGREDNKNLNDWCQLICANNTSTTKSIVNKATIKVSQAHFQGNVSCETFHEIEIKLTFCQLLFPPTKD